MLLKNIYFYRQFKEAAKERYFKNLNQAIYFHSMIAEYFMGTWGGGRPKPFKYTEVQRMRFVNDYIIIIKLIKL